MGKKKHRRGAVIPFPQAAARKREGSVFNAREFFTLAEIDSIFKAYQQDNSENAEERFLDLTVYCHDAQRNARRGINADQLKEMAYTDWNRRFAEAGKYLVRAAQALEHPVYGRDRDNLAHHFDFPPHGLNNALKKPAKRPAGKLDAALWELQEDVTLPIDLGTTEGIRWLLANGVASGALYRIAVAMLEVSKDREFIRNTHRPVLGYSLHRAELIGRRGRASDGTSAMHGLVVRELVQLLPNSIADRYALISKLAGKIGYTVTRQNVRGILKGGRT